MLDESAGVPVVLHWGAPLGDVDPSTVAVALARPQVAGGLDVVAPVSILPEHGSGWGGRPGLAGHRKGGTAWSPRFRTTTVEHLTSGLAAGAPGEAGVGATGGAARGVGVGGPEGVDVDRGVGDGVASGVVVEAVDEVAELRVVTTVRLGDWLSVRVRVENLGSTRYLLDGVRVTLPLPADAAELLTFDGRWAREFQPVRRPWPGGAWTSENVAGRTSHDHPPLLFAGTAGFGEWSGEVWGVHLAWSGNHALLADRLADGRRYVQAGELLHPGEWCLEPGDSYDAPEVVATYAPDGLTPASWGFHAAVRSSPAFPARPRPVLLNTWEAVYFDHDVDRLKELATVAAGLGIERFVLDDGWFGSRRDDRRGLGDWWVSADVYPDGLVPLIDHVRGLGMEFGIWVEPEMVNPDSDLYRAHPDWVLATPGYEPVTGRHQLVLDLARPEAFEHVLGLLDALLRDHDIAYVKWDMNRNHAQGSGADGAAGTHAQTLAVYRLLDGLRRRHPGVEIESCASGGGRIDLEILRRTERVWTSDCNDALERQTIQRGASMLLPAAVMGAHIGPTRSHTTGRVHSLAFRALTALWGHLGVEWNVLSLADDERSALAAAIELHRRFRPLLHGGDVVRFDPVPDAVEPCGHAYGVYSPDRREALVAYAQLRTGAGLLAPPLRLPGLDPATRYRVEQVPLPGHGARWQASGIELTGAQLAAHGLQLPYLHPESGLLLHLTAT